jgi:alkylation response protein AidB-like acyl-CoA dehydrogenase
MTTSTRGPRREPMALALRALTSLAGRPALDRWGLRRWTERAAYHATRTGMSAASAASRRFAPVGRSAGAPARPAPAGGDDLFDLTPTESQEMLVEVVRAFAAERLRPAADAADRAQAPPDGLVSAAGNLGVALLAVPESLGGLTDERSVVTGVLVAEALAHGDLGLAVACLAPGAVATALALWGDGGQQATYLPAFTGDDPLRAALALLEPAPLADVRRPATTAVRTPGGWRLDGEKSLVPAAAAAELFVVGAQVDGEGPALFVVESTTAGLAVAEEPAMGLRAAATGRLRLTGAVVPDTARLDGPAGPAVAYAECVRLARLAWSALAVGTAQAVVDHVIPYVNERQAFGEPISHRQAVAFTVADMATELAGARLAVLRAAARLERGADAAREVALARHLAARYGMAIASDGVQLLGGHGYVREHPVERWYRDLRAVSVLEGAVLV